MFAFHPDSFPLDARVISGKVCFVQRYLLFAAVCLRIAQTKPTLPRALQCELRKQWELGSGKQASKVPISERH